MPHDAPQIFQLVAVAALLCLNVAVLTIFGNAWHAAVARLYGTPATALPARTWLLTRCWKPFVGVVGAGVLAAVVLQTHGWAMLLVPTVAQCLLAIMVGSTVMAAPTTAAGAQPSRSRGHEALFAAFQPAAHPPQVRRTLLVAAVLVLLIPACVVLYRWEDIPQTIVVHWGVEGPDSWGEKQWFTVFAASIFGLCGVAVCSVVSLLNARMPVRARSDWGETAAAVWVQRYLSSTFIGIVALVLAALFGVLQLAMVLPELQSTMESSTPLGLALWVTVTVVMACIAITGAPARLGIRSVPTRTGRGIGAGGTEGPRRS